jgi:O-acetyl-ADP-ribose deacetylase (regulator of RNase III)
MTDLTSVATTIGREASAKARAFAETNPVAKKAKDAVFTAVGAGVLGAQKATAAFKNVQENMDVEGLKSSVADVTTNLKRQAAWVDGQVVKTIKSIDEAVAPFEQKLPSAVRDAANKAREARAKAHAKFTAQMSQVEEVVTAAPAKAPAARVAKAAKATKAAKK